MNYFEFTDPYYSLIKAKDDVDAVKKYIEVVAGDDDDIQMLLDESKIVPEYYAVARFIRSIDESGKLIDLDEALEVLKSIDAEVLLIDGCLI